MRGEGRRGEGRGGGGEGKGNERGRREDSEEGKRWRGTKIQLYTNRKMPGMYTDVARQNLLAN